jgi:hypothetical protein
MIDAIDGSVHGEVATARSNKTLCSASQSRVGVSDPDPP